MSMRAHRAAVLMYHRVEAPDEPSRFLSVPAPAFRRQMRVLRSLGYRGVTLEQVARAFRGECALPKRPVCVTFDDAYTCVADHAAPVLAELGWPGTVFVPTAHVGSSNRWDEGTDKPLRPILDWARLAELASAGWEVSGHTRTHAHLADLPDDAALAEIAGGRDDIKNATGVAPVTFCYPFGSLNERTPRLVEDAGFLCACTTVSGTAVYSGDLFRMPRVKIAYRDGVAGLLYRLLVRPYLP